MSHPQSPISAFAAITSDRTQLGSSKLEERTNRRHRAIHLGVGHARKQREGQAAAGIPVGYGKACVVDFRVARQGWRLIGTG
jgi:hypothetical protein